MAGRGGGVCVLRWWGVGVEMDFTVMTRRIWRVICLLCIKKLCTVM